MVKYKPSESGEIGVGTITAELNPVLVNAKVNNVVVYDELATPKMSNPTIPLATSTTVEITYRNDGDETIEISASPVVEGHGYDFLLLFPPKTLAVGASVTVTGKLDLITIGVPREDLPLTAGAHSLEISLSAQRVGEFALHPVATYTISYTGAEEIHATSLSLDVPATVIEGETMAISGILIDTTLSTVDTPVGIPSQDIYIVRNDVEMSPAVATNENGEYAADYVVTAEDATVGSIKFKAKFKGTL